MKYILIMNTFKRDYLLVIAAFVVSSIWYGPMQFGKQGVDISSSQGQRVDWVFRCAISWVPQSGSPNFELRSRVSWSSDHETHEN